MSTIEQRLARQARHNFAQARAARAEAMSVKASERFARAERVTFKRLKAAQRLADLFAPDDFADA